MTVSKYTEEDLAAIVVEHFEKDGWDVYQEVEYVGGVVDIVAKKGPIVFCIECKKSFGFPVIEQAFRWINRSHFTAVAVPYNRSRPLAEKLCSDYGIGVFKVDIVCREVHRRIDPKLFRKTISLPILRREQKTFCKAGSSSGGHWTRFKGTKELAICEVKRNPGISLKDLISKVDHHYSTNASARACLGRLIGTSAIPELKTETIDNNLCVFLAETLS